MSNAEDFGEFSRDIRVQADLSPAARSGGLRNGLAGRKAIVLAQDSASGQPSSVLLAHPSPFAAVHVRYDVDGDSAAAANGAATGARPTYERFEVPTFSIHANRTQEPQRGAAALLSLGEQPIVKNLGTPVLQFEERDPGGPTVRRSAWSSDLLRVTPDGAFALLGNDGAEQHPADVGVKGLSSGGFMGWSPALAAAGVSIRTRVGDAFAPMRLGPAIEAAPGAPVAGTIDRELNARINGAGGLGGSGDGPGGGAGGGAAQSAQNRANDLARRANGLQAQADAARNAASGAAPGSPLDVAARQAVAAADAANRAAYNAQQAAATLGTRSTRVNGPSGSASGPFQAGSAPGSQSRLDALVGDLNTQIAKAQSAYQASLAAQDAVSAASAAYARAREAAAEEFQFAPDDSDASQARVAAAEATATAAAQVLADARKALGDATLDYQAAVVHAQRDASQLAVDPGTIQLGIQNAPQGSAIGLVPDGNGGFFLGDPNAPRFGLFGNAAGSGSAAAGTGALLNESINSSGNLQFSVFGSGYSAGVGINIDVPTAFFGAGADIASIQKNDLAAIFARPEIKNGGDQTYRRLLAALKANPQVFLTPQESASVLAGVIPQRIVDAGIAAGVNFGAGGPGGAGNVPAPDIDLTGLRLDTLFGDYAGLAYPLSFDAPIGESAHDFIFQGQQWGVGYLQRRGRHWHPVVPLSVQVPPQVVSDPGGDGKTTTPDPEPRPPLPPPPVGKARGGPEDPPSVPKTGGDAKRSGDGQLVPCSEDPLIGDPQRPIIPLASFAAQTRVMGTTAAQMYHTAGRTGIPIARPIAYTASMDQRVRLGGGPFMRGAPLVPAGGIRLIDPFDINTAMTTWSVHAGEIAKINQLVSAWNERFPHGPNAVDHAGLRLPTQPDPAKVRLDVLDAGTQLLVRLPASRLAPVSTDQVLVPHLIVLDPKTKAKRLAPLADFQPDRMLGCGFAGDSIVFRFDTGLAAHATDLLKPRIGWDGSRKTLAIMGADLDLDHILTPTFADASDATKLAAFDVSGIARQTTQTFAFPNKSGTFALTSDVSALLPINLAGGAGEVTGLLPWANVNKAGSSLADLATRDHTALTSIGTNTHAQIDTFIASKAAASGLASLDASSHVVQVLATAINLAASGAGGVTGILPAGNLPSDVAYLDQIGTISATWTLGSGGVLDGGTAGIFKLPSTAITTGARIIAINSGHIYFNDDGNVRREVHTTGRPVLFDSGLGLNPCYQGPPDSDLIMQPYPGYGCNIYGSDQTSGNLAGGPTTVRAGNASGTGTGGKLTTKAGSSPSGTQGDWELQQPSGTAMLTLGGADGIAYLKNNWNLQGSPVGQLQHRRGLSTSVATLSPALLSGELFPLTDVDEMVLGV